MKYKLFSNVVLSIGSKNSLIVDLQRRKLYKIDNISGNYLKQLEHSELSQVLKSDTLNYQKKFQNFLNRLVKLELLHAINEEEEALFPKLELEFDYPNIISNILIDIDEKFNLFGLKKALLGLNLMNVELRLFGNINSTLIEDILILLKLYDPNFVFIKLSFKEFKNLYKDVLLKYSMIRVLEIYSSYREYELIENNRILLFKSNFMESKVCCGTVSSNYFTINIHSFSEAIHFNSCLNRKISIDSQGNIKNCPSMLESYGNISDTTLLEALGKPGFKKYWDINKDKIHVCKDCEFRYVCTDCRAYVEDPEDILSKPLKCGYNPYTGEWSEWSTNPLKQKAIDFYGMRDMVNEANKL